ncbi:hypothetical protein VNG_0079H [Halobacterium salinarum NRC-1]|uniref:Spurious ORF n=1 Tax=Halobacterium salinarum (strain ATCC 700922 / JCM 11081 / NRC-1) TaxID=64091 RepID=Q9HST8_HALSA|nr:hypothetical protein VNG_0079H [Halobacterium salinarum NRC-1]DAC77399.1 TPA_inf: spurious ORF [Halobacterium salinarum NRC-1]
MSGNGSRRITPEFGGAPKFVVVSLGVAVRNVPARVALGGRGVVTVVTGWWLWGFEERDEHAAWSGVSGPRQ